MAGQPHHRGRRYVTESRRVRLLAERNPAAVCWRDGLTLAEHVVAKPGGDNRWTAGHTVDASRAWQPWLDVERVPPAGDWLAPEVARCNYSAAAIAQQQSSRPRW